MDRPPVLKSPKKTGVSPAAGGIIRNHHPQHQMRLADRIMEEELPDTVTPPLLGVAAAAAATVAAGTSTNGSGAQEASNNTESASGNGNQSPKKETTSSGGTNWHQRTVSWGKDTLLGPEEEVIFSPGSSIGGSSHKPNKEESTRSTGGGTLKDTGSTHTSGTGAGRKETEKQDEAGTFGNNKEGGNPLLSKVTPFISILLHACWKTPSKQTS